VDYDSDSGETVRPLLLVALALTLNVSPRRFLTAHPLICNPVQGGGMGSPRVLLHLFEGRVPQLLPCAGVGSARSPEDSFRSTAARFSRKSCS